MLRNLILSSINRCTCDTIFLIIYIKLDRTWRGSSLPCDDIISHLILRTLEIKSLFWKVACYSTVVIGLEKVFSVCGISFICEIDSGAIHALVCHCLDTRTTASGPVIAAPVTVRTRITHVTIITINLPTSAMCWSLVVTC